VDRSAIMRSVKSKGTKPEMRVRQILYSLGYRYRLHERSLPGTPDIAFLGRRKAILVHGCFWHGHCCTHGLRKPRTNASYWEAKISKNVARDRATEAALKSILWTALTIWECELREPAIVEKKLKKFLGPPRITLLT
jgi:DNA mismatch endonuclease (patch repair protein)